MSMIATRFFSPGGAAANTGDAIKMSAAIVFRIRENLPRFHVLCSLQPPGVTMAALTGQLMVGTSDAVIRPADGSADEIAVELTDRFWKRLCVFAARALRDRLAGDDVAQVTLPRVCASLPV